MNPEIFREYDIRGRADADLPDAEVRRLGLAIGVRLRRQEVSRVVVGRDARPSSLRLQAAVAGGLGAAGLEVVDLGLCPTPVLYWACVRLGTGAGVMVTGSHNPPEYNGFKVLSRGRNWFGPELQEVRMLMEGGAAGGSGAGALGKPAVPAVEAPVDEAARGSSLRTGRADPVGLPSAALAAYLDEVSGDFEAARAEHRPGNVWRLNVVVDAGNGVAGLTAPALYRQLGCGVHELFCEPDGTFPYHHPDPIVDANLEPLVEEVRRRDADLGLAFDGDGDRIGVVDRGGRIIRADELLILFGRDLLRRHAGLTVIADVKCSRRLFEDLRGRGARVLMWRTGHSLIKAKMQEERALLAGELAGHICFGDRFLPFDDAVYVGARLLEILAAGRESVSELLADLPMVFSTPEIRVFCPEHCKFEVVRRVRESFEGRIPLSDVDGLRVEFPDGWGLLRASNTQPALALRFEAESGRRLEEIRLLVESRLKESMREICEESRP
jgi:phosphomannomutase/phosphoglucomutase